MYRSSSGETRITGREVHIQADYCNGMHYVMPAYIRGYAHWYQSYHAYFTLV